MVARIQALTFDLWDTLVVDDSDEPKRKACGLRSKREERRYLTWEALNAVSPLPLAEVTLAFDLLDAAFNKVWHDQHVTWPLADRFEVLLKGLGRTLPVPALELLLARQAAMEADTPPDPIPGVHDALARLHETYRLAVVSDAVFTPGASLRRILEAHGLARFFDAFIFSDEVGRSKPHRRMFAAAADALGVELTSMLHVGDRQHNDVAGAQAAGLKAVIFVASRAVDRGRHTADALCERFTDLPAIIDRLAR
jgi:putative hydrolase of the HAD superfamily